MGIDWILGDDGPVLLEVNARPGLEIQNVTGIGLDGMMSKVADLTVHTPQKGVEIATSLFSPHEHEKVSKHRSLYLSQLGSVQWRDGGLQSKDVIVTVSIAKKLTYVSPALADLLCGKDSVSLRAGSASVGSLSSLRVDDTLNGYQVRLGTQALQGFSIKPQHTMKHDTSIFAAGAMKGDDYTELQLFDQKLHDVAKQFSLSKILQPLNYLEEFHRFVDARGSYNPQFFYDFPSKKKLRDWEQSLTQLGAQYRGAQQFVSPFGQMLYDYMDELGDKIALIRAYKDQNPDTIRTYNERLYGAFDDERIALAMTVLREHDDVVSRVASGSVLAGQELVQYIRQYLDDHNLQCVKVVVDPTLSARIAVRLGSRVKVVVSSRASFARHKIDATLAHEVGVHVMRYIHGKASGWQILKRGTAGYLATEEGLALHAADEVHRSYFPNYVNIAINQKYILSAQGTLSFEHMYDFLRGWKCNEWRTLGGMFHTIIKQKKGVMDTSNEDLTGVIRSKVYLDGYYLVDNLSSEQIKGIMCGKIASTYADLF